MPISSEKLKEYRRIGHHLKPVVMVGDGGASQGVLTEIKRALSDHELIKIRVKAPRDLKHDLIESICGQCDCELVQTIGNVALLLKLNRREAPRLSNIARNYAK